MVFVKSQQPNKFPNRIVVWIPHLRKYLISKFIIDLLIIHLLFIFLITLLIWRLIMKFAKPFFCYLTIISKNQTIDWNILNDKVRLFEADRTDSVRILYKIKFIHVPFDFSALFTNSTNASFALMLIVQTKHTKLLITNFAWLCNSSLVAWLEFWKN